MPKYIVAPRPMGHGNVYDLGPAEFDSKSEAEDAIRKSLATFPNQKLLVARVVAKFEGSVRIKRVNHNAPVVPEVPAVPSAPAPMPRLGVPS